MSRKGNKRSWKNLGFSWNPNKHGEAVASSSDPYNLCRVAVADITLLKQAEEAKLQIKIVTAANRDLEREIVRRKKVEKALRQSEEALLESGVPL